MDLILNLKGVYFDEIEAGTKREEYRLYNDYWRKRLEGRTFDRVIIARGYPKANDDAKRIILPWKGYRVIDLNHPFFGASTVKVFAISADVANRL